MADQIADLYVLLTAKTSQFKSAMDEAEGKATKTSSAIGGVAKAAGVMSAAAVGAAGAMGVWAVEGAAKLEQSLARLQTQAGASAGEVKTMHDAVLNMAGQVGAGPEQLSDALFHVESAGYRGATAIKILKAAAEGAAVSGANLTDVTNALDAAVVSGIKGADNFNAAMGILNATVGSGDMTMQNLADAMSTGLLASAKAFGLTLTDVGAALATFGDNNIRGSDAATKLRMAISLMGAPSSAAVKAFNSIGLNATSLADDMRKPDGLVVALSDLQSHLNHINPKQLEGGLAEAKQDLSDFGFTTDQINQMVGKMGPTATEQSVILARAFGGGRTSGAILTLLNQLDRVKSKYGDITNGANTFGQSWATQQETLEQKEKNFDASLQSTRDRIGDLLKPLAGAGLDVLSKTILPDVAKGFEEVVPF
jgi:hypothetical protein